MKQDEDIPGLRRRIRELEGEVETLESAMVRQAGEANRTFATIADFASQSDRHDAPSRLTEIATMARQFSGGGRS